MRYFAAFMMLCIALLCAPANTPAADDSGVIRFGVPPWQKDISLDDIRGRYKPLLEWLGEQVGARFEIVGAKDYKEIAGMLASGTVGIATISPEPYVQAQRANPGVHMIVTELSRNKETGKLVDSYGAYILALKSRADLRSVADLRNKSFAFVTKESTSGYVVPHWFLGQADIVPEKFFAKTYFLGSHPRVTDAIAAGSVDAGATWDFNWNEAIKKHGDIFKAIATEPRVPNIGIAVHPSLSQDLQRKIADALLRVDPHLLEGLPAAGYVTRPDAFYDVIRKIDR